MMLYVMLERWNDYRRLDIRHRRPHYMLPLVFALMLVGLFCFGITEAFAQDAGTVDPKPDDELLLPTDQLWAFFAASIVMLPTYAFNRWAPYTDETIKGFVHIVVTAAAAGITQAITAGNVGFNQTTLQFVGLSVIGAFIVHKNLWQVIDLARKAGAGQNRQSVNQDVGHR